MYEACSYNTEEAKWFSLNLKNNVEMQKECHFLNWHSLGGGGGNN